MLKELNWLGTEIQKLLGPKVCKTLGYRDPMVAKRSTTQANDFIVYLTPGGKKYHYRTTCPALQHTKRKPVSMTHSKALDGGYTPCEKCCYDYLKYF